MIMIIKQKRKKKVYASRIFKALKIWTLDKVGLGYITRQIYATHKKVWLENMKSGKLMVKDVF